MNDDDHHLTVIKSVKQDKWQTPHCQDLKKVFLSLSLSATQSYVFLLESTLHHSFSVFDDDNNHDNLDECVCLSVS